MGIYDRKNTVKNFNVKNNLKKYRVWKKLNQIQLSKILEISVAHLRKIENNETYPKFQVRKRICEFFNISQNQMWYFDDGKKFTENIR